MGVKKRLKAIDFITPNDFDSERSVINNEYWLTKNLIEKSKDFTVFDLDLISVDLGVMPWCCNSIMHFIGHTIDVNESDIKYPVIIAPSGWVLNGWHRIVKAIIMNERSVPAVRFVDMPDPDGTEEEK